MCIHISHTTHDSSSLLAFIAMRVPLFSPLVTVVISFIDDDYDDNVDDDANALAISTVLCKHCKWQKNSVIPFSFGPFLFFVTSLDSSESKMLAQDWHTYVHRTCVFVCLVFVEWLVGIWPCSRVFGKFENSNAARHRILRNRENRTRH